MMKIKVIRPLDILSEPQVNAQFKLQAGHETQHWTSISAEDYFHTSFNSHVRQQTIREI